MRNRTNLKAYLPICVFLVVIQFAIASCVNTASNPSPPDGGTGVPSVILTWTRGDRADLHDVYFGTDHDAVDIATTSDGAGVYRARQVETSYMPGPLEWDQTYCWRIDEVEVDPFTIWRGDVWCFRVGETLYEFTNCGQTGPYGPSQAQCNSAYSGTSLEGQVTVNNGIQLWTILETGTYSIEAFGAKGGASTGGLGARMKGDFNLTAGTTLKILVGQMGSSEPYYHSWGGGGGTFVVKSDDTPLIIAGGGGGGFEHYELVWKQGGPGRIEQSGGPDGDGGQNGNGGGRPDPYYEEPENPSWEDWTGGGGGFYTDGEGNGGKAFLNGGYGSTALNNGGFGGGGGTSNNGYNFGGGGGGYSGGNAGIFGSYYQEILYPSSGGGGSYNSGSNQDNTSGANNGHGKVIVSVH